ncbi:MULTISPECIES: porin [Bradyrhizobium]|uniref:Porin n=2 Tax=Bradyrhizobium TaxID=374 RepID=A0ABY0PEU4_9BRAD|nr:MULTISPECIES: porin [Bradyrhizobium]SDI19677.1 Porin subfamily protein [Bradyrhizobium ottawaense]SED74822.1 Porin subfamily protein [Bradyrhizobium lablabi]
MNMIKSLVLSSGAILTGVVGASAADLPVKAKAVEYVRVCSLYGAGFYYMPGTDTCIKLGGYLRIDNNFNGSTLGQPAYNGDLGQGNRYRDYYVGRSRMALTVDTRTATEYGVVRTFGQGDFQFDMFGGPTTNPAVLAAPGTSAAQLYTVGGGYVGVEMVFIQFAGFTFGKSASAYATPWHGYPGNNSSFLMGGHDTVTGVNNIQYTAQFDKGVSATIGLDDPTVFNRTALWNLSLGVGSTGAGTNAYGGTHVPDIVGNIRIDQAWGMFQISAAAHLVNGSYNTLGAGGVPTVLSEISGHPDDKWGGSVMAALQIKNLPTGAGDDIKIDASYAKGDTKNIISTSGGSPSFAMFGGSGFGYRSVGFGNTSDGVYLPGAFGTGGIVLTNAWGIRGAFNHNWDPYWSSGFWAGYSSVRYDGGTNDNIRGLGTTTAKGAYCAAFAATFAGQAAAGNSVGSYTCNPDYSITQVGVVTRWTPVKGLAFSAEVGTFFLGQKMSGSSMFTATAPRPTALYEFKNQSTTYLNVRVHRDF